MSTVYVDTIGLEKSIPKNFIEVRRNVTINFKVGKYEVHIPQLPIWTCLNEIKRISHMFGRMNELARREYKTEAERIADSIRYVATQNQIIDMVINISMPFVNRKWGFKRTFRKECKRDALLLLNICENVFDYWQTVKKKLFFLSRQETLKSTGGSFMQWSKVKMDVQEKILMGPRYGRQLRLSKKETEEK